MDHRQKSKAVAKKTMLCGIFLLSILETATQDQKGFCQAEHGDDCKTVASSMMQTQRVRSRADFHESSEAGEEHYESNEANQAGLRIVKHGNFQVRVWSDAITHEDGTKTWLLTNKKNCDAEWNKKLEGCLPAGMKVIDKGNDEEGGLCFESLQGTEEELEKELSNCKDILDGNALDIETDKPVTLIPDEPDEPDESVKDDSDALAESSSSNSPYLWGLDRIDQRVSPPLSKTTYDPSPHNKRGEGVHVFVGDTGIRISHTDFGGRAFAGYDAFSQGAPQTSPCSDPKDGNCAKDRQGHGTHCAGTVGGTKYGVANNAKLYAVKVLSDGGSGSTAGIIGGINWAKQQATTNNKSPGIISLSLGGSGTSQAWKDAIDDVTRAGLMVVVAAGNSNDDACKYSPAFVPNAVTVGSTTEQDQRSSFSSWGPCVDIFAPGSHIKSAGIKSDTAQASMSGTSMACPHVAGAYALLFSANPNLDRAGIEALMNAKGTKNEGFAKNGGPDNFLYVGPGTAPPTPAPTPAPPPQPTPVADCDFEGSCFWYNLKGGDDFDWQIGQGGTPSKNTGPPSAANGVNYVFIETSSPRKSGDTAILQSPPLIFTGKMELEFLYHMYGSDIGSLAITVDGIKKWERRGNQGNSWNNGWLMLENSGTQQPEIAFVGTRGGGWAGDIAIDSVRFVPKTGPTTAPTAMPTPSPTMAPTAMPTAAPVSPTMSPTAMPTSNPVVVVGPPGLPGPPGPPGKDTTNVGPPGPPGPPR